MQANATVEAEAKALLDDGDIEGASTLLAAHLANGPGNPKLHLDLAGCYLQLDQCGLAVSH